MKLLSLSEVEIELREWSRVHEASASNASNACHAWVVRGDEEGGTGWVQLLQTVCCQP